MATVTQLLGIIKVKLEGVEEAAKKYAASMEAMRKASETTAKATTDAQKKAQAQQQASAKATTQATEQQAKATTGSVNRIIAAWNNFWSRFKKGSQEQVAQTQEATRAQGIANEATADQYERLTELQEKYAAYKKKGGKLPPPVTEEEIAAFEEDAKRFESTGKKHLNFLSKLTNEMARIGALRGGAEVRVARALGGWPLVVMGGVMLAQMALKQFRKAVDETVDAIEKLGKTGTAMRAFASMGQSAGITFDGMAQAIREVSGYAIDNYEAWTIGNKLLAAGFDDVAASMLPLAEVARTMGEALGVEAKQQLNALLDAITKGDVQVLQAQWGFTGINTALLEAADSMGIAVGDMNDLTKATIILNKAMPQLNGVLDRFGGSASNSAGDVKEFVTQLDRLWQSIKTGIGIELAQTMGLAPSELTALGDQTDAVNQYRLMIGELQKQVEDGIIPEEVWEQERERYLQFAKPPGFLEQLLSAFVPKGIVSFTKFDTSDATKRIEWFTAGVKRLQEALADDKALTDFERRVRDATINIADMTAEYDKARAFIGGKKIEWAVDLSEFMPVEDAIARAEYLGDEAYDKLAAAISATGNFASSYSQITIAEIERQHATFIDGLKETTITAMGEMVAEIIGNTFQAYKSAVGGAMGLALSLTEGMKPEEALAKYGKVQAAYDKWYAQWQFAPGGGVESFAAQAALRDIEGLLEQDKEVSDMIADQITDWAVEAAEFMPFPDALKLAQEWGKALETGIGPYTETLGEPAMAAAQAIVDTIKRGWDEMLEDVEKKSPQAYREMSDDLAAEAQKAALRLAPYMPFADIEKFLDAALAKYATWQETWFGRENLPEAQYYLKLIDTEIDDIVDAIVDAHKETKATAKSMKDFAENTLLGSKALGTWAAAFAAEHGGAGPMEQYKKHEQPLVAAMIDKLWGEDFAKKMGRPPNYEEWQAHWFEQWAPLELYPGGPIAAATGPEAERAKAVLKLAGIEDDLGQVYNDEYLKRLGLVEAMTAEQTQTEKLAEALGNWAAYINGLIPPSGEEDGDEDGDGDKPPDEVIVIDPETGQPVKPRRGGPVEFQHGGITKGAGLAFLHPNEAVIPLGGGTFGGPGSSGSIGGGVEATLRSFEGLLSDINTAIAENVLPAFDTLSTQAGTLGSVAFRDWIGQSAAFADWNLDQMSASIFNVAEVLTDELAAAAIIAAAALRAIGGGAGDEVPPPPPPPGDEDGEPSDEDWLKKFEEEWGGGLGPGHALPWWVPGQPKSAQQGGWTRGEGLVHLHPNELILPLSNLPQSVTMRMAGFGGGVSIGTMNIPVTVSGSNLRPADVQAAVVEGIRVRGGAEIMRSARRLGL